MLDRTLVKPQVTCLIMFTPLETLYQCGQRVEIT
jgi:hypothetical protein